MAAFTPLSQADLAQLMATEFASLAGTNGVKAPNTDAGSAMGGYFQAGAFGGTLIQNEILYIIAIERMATIPALPNGQPNPDLDSFCAPFGVTRLGASEANGVVTCSTPSPVSQQITIPAGAILATPLNVQFQIQSGGAGYDPSTGGYDIPAGQSSVDVPVVCLTPGIAGNVLAGTTFTATGIGGPIPPSVSSITNADTFNSAQAAESDAAFKTRFTIEVSSGRAGTRNAIVAAVLAEQVGIIYSFGDRVDLDLTEHDAYFTFIVNEGNTGAAAPSGLILEAEGAIEAVRSAGISYQVLGPTTIPVAGAATTLVPTAQFVNQPDAVLAAAQAAFQTFVDAIGLNVDTSPTICSIARCYAALLGATINGVPCIFDATGLTLNSSAVDLSAAFGSQFVAGEFTVG